MDDSLCETIGPMTLEQSFLPLQWRKPSVTLKPLNESFPADTAIRLGVLFGACRWSASSVDGKAA